MPHPLEPHRRTTPDVPAGPPLHALTLTAAADALRDGTSATALADAALQRIAATEPVVHAWATVDPAHVHEAAAAADADLAARRSDRVAATAAAAAIDRPLRGLGIGLKDIIDTAALPTMIGTSIHAGRGPSVDAACAKRLQSAGGYVFGKTVTTAFAFLDAGPTCNPWHPGHTPGGSSSGSAAAVASAQIAGALGTQTNGSVIRPAAFCGVVGFKPTFGWLDFSGVHLFSATLDTLGTFTRTVADAALLAGALAPSRRIPRIAATPGAPPHLAYLSAFPWTPLLPGMDDALTEAAVRLRMAGATVTPVSFPEAWRDANRVHRTLMLYEGARSLALIQAAHRDRMSALVNAALDEGHGIAEADYRAALAARDQAIAYFTEWLAPYDAVISPPATGGAPAGLASTGDPGCCSLWSLTGFPAIALPIALDANGLPLGLQLAAQQDAERELLAVAAWCEAQLGWQARIAPVAPAGAGNAAGAG